MEDPSPSSNPPPERRAAAEDNEAHQPQKEEDQSVEEARLTLASLLDPNTWDLPAWNSPTCVAEAFLEPLGY